MIANTNSLQPTADKKYKELVELIKITNKEYEEYEKIHGNDQYKGPYYIIYRIEHLRIRAEINTVIEDFFDLWISNNTVKYILDWLELSGDFRIDINNWSHTVDLTPSEKNMLKNYYITLRRIV